MKKNQEEVTKKKLEAIVRVALVEGTNAFNRGDLTKVVTIFEKVLREGSSLFDGVIAGIIKKEPYGLKDGERIRFAKDTKGKKAVMFTRKDAGIVYFGIARCNRDAGDSFDRELGVNLARQRAKEVEELCNDHELIEGCESLSVTDDGLAGSVCVEDIYGLLDYFYAVTER